MQLTSLGWNAHWQQKFAPFAASHVQPARVAVQHNHLYRLEDERGTLLAEVAGRVRHAVTSAS